MNSSVFYRFSTLLLALLFSVVLSRLLLPDVSVLANQLDFWLAWLLCMLLLAWPLNLLELALSRRQAVAPLQALSALTREADVSPRWRVVGWFSVLLLGVVSGALCQQLSTLWLHTAPTLPLKPTAFSLHLTALTFSEMAQAVLLAVFCNALGLGLYWQQSTQRIESTGTVAATTPSPFAPLVLWLTQLSAGVAALALGLLGGLSPLLSTICTLLLLLIVLNAIRQQLAARGLRLPLQIAVMAATGALGWLGSALGLWGVLAVLGLLSALAWSVFVGWQMKISHLRKALGFQHEGLYNLWRVAVRVLIPLLLLLAIAVLLQRTVALLLAA